MPYIQVDDIKMYFRVFNNGAETEKVDKTQPTLIVLHGGPGIVDHKMEVGFWSKLSSSLQVIFPDQRGNGLTEDGDPAKWDLKQCGKDVYTFSNALGIKQPIIAGVSWGGYVVMSYAKQYPAHSRALIFCNTEAKVSAQARKAAFEKLGGSVVGEAAYAYDMDPEAPGKFDTFIKHCLPYFSRTSLTLVEPTRVNMLMRTKFIKEENQQFDFRSSLATIQQPVLLLAGDHDPVHPLKCAEETAACIPKAFSNLRVIKNAGAPVYQDQLDETFKTILDFMKSLSERNNSKNIATTSASIRCAL
jgi:pimeloyl-ACP methyl ester carboxylesterase